MLCADDQNVAVRAGRERMGDIEGDQRLVIVMVDVGQVVELCFAQLGDRSEEAAPTRFGAESLKALHEPRTIVGTYLTDRDARSVSKLEAGIHEGTDSLQRGGGSRSASARGDLRLGQVVRD